MSTELVALPAQPALTPWPTHSWPVGDLVADDPRAVRSILERPFVSQPRDDLALTLAVLVVQGGRITWEGYGPDTGPDTPLISWSMAKSITQAALGVVAHNDTVDLDVPLGGADARLCVPEWCGAGDPRGGITLGDLLRMRSGLEWSEDYVDAGSSHCLAMLFGDGAEDMAAYAASLPSAAPPGAVFNYSSGTTNIVARLTSGLVGGGREQMADLLASGVFSPLGITSADPRFDPAGTFVGSSYVWATARDFARFGLWYLRDGVWEGRRLLPEGWVDRARRLVSVDAETGNGYGEHWWVRPSCPWGTFWANGYEGQSITVVPALDTVIVRLGKTPVSHRESLAAWRWELLDALSP